MINLAASLADRASQFKSHAQEPVPVIVISKAFAFTGKYVKDAATGRHRADKDGNIEFTHYRFRVQLSDGKIINLTVRQDYIKNEPTLTDLTGKKALAILGEGKVADKDYPKAGIKKGDVFINCERFVFDGNYTLLERASEKGIIIS